jgi:hypothetical protein
MDGFTDAECPHPPRDYLNKEREKFKDILKSILLILKVSGAHIKTDRDLIDEINTRIHQRINYYLFFHVKRLNQSRQIALKAYWILRHRPLRLISKAFWNKDYDINVYFAFYFMFAQAIGELFVNCPKEIQTTVANEILRKHQDDYIRAFSEYDIGKEAMMLISESLKSIVKCEIRERI